MRYFKKLIHDLMHGRIDHIDQYSHHRLNMYGSGAVIIRERKDPHLVD